MKRFLFSAIIALVFAGTGFSQSIFTNAITGTNPGQSNPFSTGQVVDANMTATGIGRGTGLTGANSTDSYRATDFTVGNTIVLNEFFTWTMTPNAGQQINLSSFQFTAANTGFGSSITADLRSSIDDYATSIVTLTPTGGTADLSGPSYQSLTSAVTFRLYVYGANNVNANFEINDFTFNGAVTPVPEPVSMMAIAAVGMGAFVMRRRRKMA